MVEYQIDTWGQWAIYGEFYSDITPEFTEFYKDKVSWGSTALGMWCIVGHIQDHGKTEEWSDNYEMCERSTKIGAQYTQEEARI
jgi:hypothetical protein